jgi:putative ABC transport system permease protein
VGVVGDIKHYGLDEETELEIYEPFRQFPLGYLTLVIKTDGAPERVVQPLIRLARDLEPDLPLYNVRTMEKLIDASIEHRRLAMGLLATFAALALVLAAMGTYGVMSYAVVQRTPEIGMRMALGAQTADILGLILKETAALTFAGISSGLFVAFLLSRAISSQLYNVGTFDPMVYGAVVATLSAAALVASLIPALRAARVDPLVSVRYE